MRLTTVILIASFLQVSASTFGQRITIFQKNIPLESVLKEIRKQSGFDIYYDGKTISADQKVNVSINNLTVHDAVKEALNGLNLSYEIDGYRVTIKKKEPSLLNKLASSLSAIDIRGRVVDENGVALAGATVMVQGSPARASTDEKGEFVLRNIDENAVVIIAYVGYQPVELRVKRDLGTIRMSLTNTELSEVNVVFNTGYQSIARERSAGSFAKPDLKVMLNRTGTPNILTRLEGLVPGLSSRGPQGLLVRGRTTLQDGTRPLIVIDGIEFEGDIEQVNMQDVEDINVLKDATSSSIWGAKAANGVIVITTKKGRSGDKLKIDYDGYYAFQGRPDLDYVQRMNSQQFITLARELFPQYAQFNSWRNIRDTYALAPHLQIQYGVINGKLTQAQADFKLDSLSKLSNTSQIADLFVRDSAMVNQTISVSGGGKAHSFYASLNHIGTQSNTPGQQYNQYKINLNNNFILGKRFTASVSADLTNSVTRNGNSYAPSRNIVPYQMFQDANGNPLDVNFLGSGPLGGALRDTLRTTYQARSRINLDYNPILEQDRAYNTSNGLYARLVGGMKVNLIKGLDFQGTYGYNISNTNTRGILDQNNYNMRLQVLRFTQAANTTVTPVYNIPAVGGRLDVSTSSSKAWTLRNQLVYNRDWNRHLLSVMAGQQATSSTPVSTSGTYYGWDDQLQTSRPVDFARLEAGVSGTILGTQSLDESNVGGGEGRIARTTSYYANLGYTFDRKYTVNASWRIDESNLFGRDKSAQNRPVYSIGGKWALSSEEFMRPLNWLNRLDLRLTYGITGNAPGVGAASSYDILTATNDVNYVTGAGLLLSSPANNRLTWEATKVYNAGIDFSVINNRLSGSIEGYIKKTQDLIGNLSTSPLTGYQNVIGNYGNMENKGIDIGLNSVNIRSKDFTWSSGLTFSYNKNKLTMLRQNKPETGEALVGVSGSGGRLVGYPLNARFVYNYAGLNAVGDPQIRRADGSVTAAINVATPEDILYLGSTQPVWSGGLQNSFQYKSFTLSASIIYNGGYVVVSNLYPVSNETVLNNNNLQLGFFDRWKVPGDENRTDIPRFAPSAAIRDNRNMSYYSTSKNFWLNGAYAKLRDITVSYSLPGLVANKISAQAISFRFQVNNLLLWTANDQGMDPEFNGSTRDAQGTVSLGAHITF